jgi:hypothetical protein
MQAGVEQGAHEGVDRRDAGRRRFRGHGFPEVFYIFVTNRYDVVFIEGIGITVASFHLHQQRARQSERREKLLQLLEEADFLQLLVNRLMRRILGGHIAHAHPVGPRGRGLRCRH